MISYYNFRVEVHASACRHGVADEDIEHAIENAMVIKEADNDERLYIGPARNAALFEVATIVRSGRRELAIHAMAMRKNKYQQLLPEG
jgi:hypothetical protein